MLNGAGRGGHFVRESEGRCGEERSGRGSEGGGRTVTAEQRGVGSSKAACVSGLVGERSGQKSVRAERCGKGRARPPPCCAPLLGKGGRGERLPSGVGEGRKEKIQNQRSSSGQGEHTAAGPGPVTLSRLWFQSKRGGSWKWRRAAPLELWEGWAGAAQFGEWQELNRLECVNIKISEIPGKWCKTY